MSWFVCMGMFNCCNWDLLGLGSLNGLLSLFIKFDNWLSGMNCFLLDINDVYLR